MQNDLEKSGQETLFFYSRPTPLTPNRLAIIGLTLVSAVLGALVLYVPSILIMGGVLAIFFVLLVIRYPFFGLLCYYVVLVVEPATLASQLAALHPERLVGGVLFVSLLIHKRHEREKIHLLDDRISWNLAFFILAMLLSVPFSFWPTSTFWTVIDFLKTALFYFFIVNLVNTEKRLRVFVWTYIIVFGYTALSTAIAYHYGTLVVAQGIPRAISLSGLDPNTLAVTLVIALPFAIFAIGWTKRRFFKILPAFFALISVYVIVLTGSRGGLLGLLAMFFFIWLGTRHKMLIAIAVAVLVVGTWVVLPGDLQHRYETIVSSEHDASTVGRFDAWEAGMDMFYSRPFFGVGAGSFAYAYGSGDFSDRSTWLQSHSMYVQLLAETGLLGTIVFGMFTLSFMRRNFRIRKAIRGAQLNNVLLAKISYAITSSTAALVVTAMFGHSLFRLHWYLAAALTVSLSFILRDLSSSSVKGEFNSDAR